MNPEMKKAIVAWLASNIYATVITGFLVTVGLYIVTLSEGTQYSPESKFILITFGGLLAFVSMLWFLLITDVHALHRDVNKIMKMEET